MKRSGGFTLIELMVVIGIMVLIASIVVTGSFGMSRASGYMAAESVVYNTLQAARQKACTDGKRVLVAFVKIKADANTDIDDYSLVTVEAAGTIDGEVHRRFFYDRTSALANFQNTQSDESIWNLTTGACVQGPFTNYVNELPSQIPSETGGYDYSTTVVEVLGSDSFSPSEWKDGHLYGFQIGETQELPTGFKIKLGDSSPEGHHIKFEPDGRSMFDNSADGKGVTIKIYEEIAQSHPIEITVKDGVIKVEKTKGQ